MTLGGRVAEDIIFGRISTGAQNDLERITKMAYAMVSIYGMNAKVGNVSFNDPQGEYGLTKPYSDNTAQMIDQEVRNLIQSAYDRTKNLLLEKRDLLEALTQQLLKKEIIFQSDLEGILGKRPFDHKTTYQEYMTSDDDKAAEPVAELPVAENTVTPEITPPPTPEEEPPHTT
jgi:AFG3 family protein